MTLGDADGLAATLPEGLVDGLGDTDVDWLLLELGVGLAVVVGLSLGLSLGVNGFGLTVEEGSLDGESAASIVPALVVALSAGEAEVDGSVVPGGIVGAAVSDGDEANVGDGVGDTIHVGEDEGPSSMLGVTDGEGSDDGAVSPAIATQR